MKLNKFLTTLATAIIPTVASAGDILPMLIGTYTDGGSHGIYSFTFNQENGSVELKDSLQMVNPSYLTLSADNKFIYAVSEQSNDNASLNAIGYDKQTGKMELLQSVLTNGADPCYVETNERIALTSNYTGGSMSVFWINKNGTLTEMTQQFDGATGGNRPQQSSAHIHMSRFLNKNTVLATDFSADRLLRFRLAGNLLTNDGVAGNTLPHSGPRHIEWSKSKKHIYTINELSGTVSVFHNIKGSLNLVQTIESDSVDGGGCADIHLSANGEYLYTSNRLKEDGISIFKVNKKDGKLVKVGYQHTGIHPRNFIITPNGKFLLVACRDTNNIQVFIINKETGMLTNMNKDIQLSKPVCIRFGKSL